MNINYYDLYYTVFKNRNDKEFVNVENENDFINFNDIIPNRCIGRKTNNEILLWRKMRSVPNDYHYR